MTFNTTQVVLDGFSMNDFIFTMTTADTVTAADVGKAVTLDPTTPGMVKLVGADDPVYGRIFQVETRSQEGVTTVAVETKFRNRLKTDPAAAPVIGKSVVGAANGLVKEADPSPANVILAVRDGYVIVQQN